MEFSKLLNDYIKTINCSSKELAKKSNLSQTVISRYRNGSRIPTNNSIHLNQLINGLAILAKEKNIKNHSKKEIESNFNKILNNFDFNQVIDNFNKLIPILKINISDFAKTLGFDASYLSLIRSKKRIPSDTNLFLEAIINYVIKNYNDETNKNKIAALINLSIEDINKNEVYKLQFKQWLCSNYKEIIKANNVSDFLKKVDEFELNNYIRSIHFDDLKVPTIPIKLPKSKNYYGIEEMKQGELDFFKATVLSKSNEDVFMCSDMQMDDMAKDLDFGKKWMFAIAMMLKKELHLNIIHNINRPFNEMILGLESWIPIYMTGLITPYYFNNQIDNIYSHLNYVSGSIALTGECITKFHNKGKYYLTNNNKEVIYYKEKSKILLKKASPLMEIYRKSSLLEFKKILNDNNFIDGNQKIIHSSLPIYTIEDKLLIRILKRNNLNSEEINVILNYVNKEKERINSILKNNNITIILTEFKESEFRKKDILIDLSNLFYENKICYTYNEYIEHLKSTKNYEKKNNNYTVTINKKNIFKNIKISINHNKWIIISKSDNPTIHFIIKHPKLIKAIEEFTIIE